MADITPQTTKRTANDITWAAASGGGDKFVNTGKELLLVKNGSGGSINVTIATPNTVDGLTIADKVIAVADGKTAVLGPWPPATYSNASDSKKAAVTYSGTSSVEVAVVKITP